MQQIRDPKTLFLLSCFTRCRDPTRTHAHNSDSWSVSRSYTVVSMVRFKLRRFTIYDFATAIALTTIRIRTHTMNTKPGVYQNFQHAGHEVFLIQHSSTGASPDSNTLFLCEYCCDISFLGN